MPPPLVQRAIAFVAAASTDALLCAAGEGNLDEVKKLVADKGDPSHKDGGGRNAIMYASLHNHS